jgi:hypothetical protein
MLFDHIAIVTSPIGDAAPTHPVLGAAFVHQPHVWGEGR